MRFAAKLDTNGSRPETVSGLLECGLIDYIAMDIKAPLNKYNLLCGLQVDTDAIRRSIDIIASSRVPHHFRTTFFRRLLSEEDLAALKELLPPHAKHLTQAFHEPQGISHEGSSMVKTRAFNNGRSNNSKGINCI